MEIDQIVAYLRGRFEQGDMVLFTGAGFSSGAKNVGGTPIPSVATLKRRLWNLVYGDLEFDEKSSLQDLFELARTRALGALRAELERQFTVERRDVPAMYATIFGLSWARVYTLNIDDLEEAVAASHPLQRRVMPLSAKNYGTLDAEKQLPVVHLNGRLVDGPDRLTFSAPQYGSRIPGVDSLYQQAAVDVLARPVVFIGTSLDEPPLWQHISLRKTAEGKDLRRRSFLVTPELPRPRQDFLQRELHVEHIPLTLEEFVERILAPASVGSQKFFSQLQQPAFWDPSTKKLPLVSRLAADLRGRPPEQDYLLGYTPEWSDIIGGRAAEREFEAGLRVRIDQLLHDQGPAAKPVIVVTSTAGSGKTTACMRLGHSLTGEGVEVGWIDEETNASPLDLRNIAAVGDLPRVVIIDDADRYGNELAPLAGELVKAPSHPVVVVSARSGRVGRIADRLQFLGIRHEEVVVPNLTDVDIERLIAVLDRFNRLGQLKNKPLDRQIREFKDAERGARQLIVAMLEVTSGRKFSEKMREEVDQLSGTQRLVYAMVAIATAYRFAVTQEQILLGVGDASNETMQAISELERRLLFVRRRSGDLQVRHRVVGERIVDHLIAAGAMREPLQSLAVAMAAQLGPMASRNAPAYRNMRVLMNHDWLRQALGIAPAKQLLGELEAYLSWDHHYWLQRGSLELESGNEALAENFLNQAAAIDPHDLLIQTELAYLRLKQAVAEPNGVHARELLEEGLAGLGAVIESRAHFDPHQYDILGKMTLQWIRRGDVIPSEREELLRDAATKLERARKVYPRDDRLRELTVLLQNERLGHTASY